MADESEIRIHHVEIRFEVDAGDQEASFARMFSKYIDQWHRRMQEVKVQARLADRERSLGDREGPR